MSADEDTELRDLIVQTLENNGVIGKIKSELRASVFLALEEEGSFRDKIPLANKKLSEYVSSSEGKMVISFVREFLEFFNLNFTLAVFDPEVSLPSDYLSRKDLITQYKLAQVNEQRPLLSEFLSGKKSDISKISHTSSAFIQPAHNQLEHLKSAEVKLDLNSNLNSGDARDSNEQFDKKSSYDPFFDEPLPTEPPTMSIFNTQRSNLQTKQKEDTLPNTKVGLNEKSDQDSFLNYLKNETGSDSKVKDKIGDDIFNTETTKLLDKKEPSIFSLKSDSFSSLKDFPPLTSRSAVDSDWFTNKSQKRTLPSLKLDSEKGMAKIDEVNKIDDELSLESERSSKSSLKSTEQSKLNSDISEQSIEEDLDEEISGVDDLLSSISVGEDSTSDHTVSNVSVTGCDYLEKCFPTK